MKQEKSIERRYIRVQTAAEMYDYNVRDLRLKCLLGQVPGATKDGKYWRIPIWGMERLMEQGLPRRRRRV